MTSQTVLKISVGAFILVFFAYLFGPLVLMSITAFNSSAFPRVSPWDCFTVEWFEVLVRDEKLMEGFRNSLIIGAGVVALAVPLGLAGAIMLTQLRRSVRSVYYTVVVSPILIPGVVLGISTLIFWDRLGTMFGADYDSVFYDGMFLTIIGQSTFISAYTMLVFIARLQRFDPALEEAALDLGATHVQAFRKILLPFLKPAVGSAAVLAFLASFENYNTTVFTIVSESTLTTVLASKVRYGINPSISSLAVIIVGVTLVGAVIYEVMRRREAKAQKAFEAEGVPAPATRAQKAQLATNPASVLLAVVFVAGLGTVWFASTYDVDECKARLKAERELIQKIRGAPAMFIPEIMDPLEEGGGVASPGAEQYRGIFDPANLRRLAPGEAGAAGESPAASPGAEQYQGIFAPGNLQQLAPEETAPAESPGAAQYESIFDPGNLQQLAPGEETEAPAESPGAEQYKSIFAPENLQQQVNPE